MQETVWGIKRVALRCIVEMELKMEAKHVMATTWAERVARHLVWDTRVERSDVWQDVAGLIPRVVRRAGDRPAEMIS